MTTYEAEVWVAEEDDNVFVGRLYTRRRRSAESATFVYDESYLARPDAYALDPALPLTGGQHQTPVDLAQFDAFRDSSPDRWGRRLRHRRERDRARDEGEQPRSLSEADFLFGVRDDLRQGSLRFRLDTEGPFVATPESGVPALADLPDLLETAGRVEDDTAGQEEVLRLVQAGSSLGGARPKAHVRDVDGRVAIAKFPSSSSDTWNVMAWEHVALCLAGSAGIRVPEARLESIANRHVLIVDRFDRDGDGHRIGYVSALTMVAARDGDQGSYLEIAEAIEEHSSKTTADLRELWRRMLLSVLISNTDDHLRNHGFLHEWVGTWRLSPAFDLNPNPQPGIKFLNTAIDDAETEASVDLVLEVADFFRLNHQEANAALQEVRSAVSAWRDVAADVGLHRQDIEEMTPAFEHPGVK